jgi:hypothetical protein
MSCPTISHTKKDELLKNKYRQKSSASPSQFIMTNTRRRRGQVGHRHYLNNQTRPSGKVLDSLALAIFWVVLFPSEPSSLPFSENVLHKIRAELSVNLGCFGLVRTSRFSNILVLTKC